MKNTLKALGPLWVGGAALMTAVTAMAVSIVPTGGPSDAAAAARGAALQQVNGLVSYTLAPRSVDLKIFSRGDGSCWLHGQGVSQLVSLSNASVIELVQAPDGQVVFTVTTAGTRIPVVKLPAAEGSDLFLKTQLCLTRP